MKFYGLDTNEAIIQPQSNKLKSKGSPKYRSNLFPWQITLGASLQQLINDSGFSVENYQ